MGTRKVGEPEIASSPSPSPSPSPPSPPHGPPGRVRSRGTEIDEGATAKPSGTTNGVPRGTSNGRTQRFHRPIPAPAAIKPFRASLHSSGERAADFCRLVKQLEVEMGIPVWMIVQGDNERGPWSAMSPRIADALRSNLFKNPEPRLAVLVHSPGGSATCAYQLGTAFARRRDGFVCIVPRYAKSAATLMALGADHIVLGRLGELGPLDAQIVNADRDESMSALDEVLSLERLQKFALDTLDVTMQFLVAKTRKRVDAILPMATQFVHGLVHPLFTGIDAVRYTQLSRTLKVAEEYAVRLMEPRLGREKAVDIANRLILAYPEHAFAIDYDEVKAIGLDVEEATGPVSDILDEMVPMLSHVSAIGTVVS